MPGSSTDQSTKALKEVVLAIASLCTPTLGLWLHLQAAAACGLHLQAAAACGLIRSAAREGSQQAREGGRQTDTDTERTRDREREKKRQREAETQRDKKRVHD